METSYIKLMPKHSFLYPKQGDLQIFILFFVKRCCILYMSRLSTYLCKHTEKKSDGNLFAVTCRHACSHSIIH